MQFTYFETFRRCTSYEIYVNGFNNNLRMSAIVDKLRAASIAFTTECLHSDSYP